jgi:hemerythrin-like domain-containing protein
MEHAVDPIRILMDEHRRIERGLDALEAFAAHVQAQAGDERAELARFADFLRGYADRHHHGKEEDILFEHMVEAGFSREDGPIAVMLHEHVEGRGHVGAMRTLAAVDVAWGEGERRKVAATARAFVHLLRDHIQKEDQVLYPMARHSLPAGDWHAMTDAFADHARANVDEELRLQRLGGELAARWLGDAGR